MKMKQVLSNITTRSILLLIAASLLARCSGMPGHKMFAPLECNALIDTDECLSNAVGFSTLFSENQTGLLTIPCGKCVFMDYTDGSEITIPGGLNVVGRLHFPSSANVKVRSTAVFVQGSWSMETPGEGNSVTISLYGSGEKTMYPHSECCTNIDDVYGYDCSCSVPEGIGKKPFVVAGGKLDIQAFDENCSAWTKLKDTNTDTMKSFTVDTKFTDCLRAGDDLLVTSDQRSTDKHTTLTVDSVDKETGEVFLEETMPRVFPSEAGPGEPEFAVEVALLRRDVIFTAEPDDEDWIGGHSIVYHTPTVEQTIRGVRFDNFGQEGVLGRYPVHFHKSGFTSSTVSKNVIINSNQRCVFIHNTDGVTIDDNVAFNTKGHCYATETGDERYNTFKYNLGAYTRKLTRSNGQSDKPDGHSTATFWIRNMENTFIGNVAAGSTHSGFWLEMKNKFSNQLNDAAFRDNSAHSSFTGMLTYKHGWIPKEPAVMINFKTYNNQEGCKFHITGNLTFKNAILADNTIGVRHGVWNKGVIFEDSKFIGLSNDQKIRMKKTCPPGGGGGNAIRAAFNNSPKSFKNVALKNVVFENYICSTETVVSYYDGRDSDDMGQPVYMENVSFVNTHKKNRPKLDGCGATTQNWYMEDYDGTLTDHKVPGFLVRNIDRTKGFLPEESCEPLPLAYDPKGCTAFCEDVCLRLVHIMPTGKVNSGNTDIDRLKLKDHNTGKSKIYSLNKWAKAIVTLPAGQYGGHFLDSNGDSVTIDDVEILTFETPRCSDFVTASNFTFSSTAPPSSSPSSAPSESPTTSAPSEVPTWAPTDFPSEIPSSTPSKYYDQSYKLSKHNYKCPYPTGRLFKNRRQYSIEQCHAECFNMPSCNFFTYRASNKFCITCSIESESDLVYHRRFTSYELTSIKTSSDFGYELWDGLKGVDKKCPWKGSDRLAKMTLTTRKECYDKCKATDNCGWFSWGEKHSSRKVKNICILCQGDGNFQRQRGIHTYEMIE